MAVWRLDQAPSLSIDDLTVPRKIKPGEWLSDPKLDGLVDTATVAGVLLFPALLWCPLIFWLLG
jgi:hypothetical protein